MFSELGERNTEDSHEISCCLREQEICPRLLRPPPKDLKVNLNRFIMAKDKTVGATKNKNYSEVKHKIHRNPWIKKNHLWVTFAWYLLRDYCPRVTINTTPSQMCFSLEVKLRCVSAYGNAAFLECWCNDSSFCKLANIRKEIILLYNINSFRVGKYLIRLISFHRRSPTNKAERIIED